MKIYVFLNCLDLSNEVKCINNIKIKINLQTPTVDFWI